MMRRSLRLALALAPSLAALAACDGGVDSLPDSDPDGSVDTDPDGSVDADSDSDSDSDGDGLFEITFIDVGQGDAALFEMPDGAVILIDGGPNGAGNSAIVPLLWERDIETIDLMVLTHPHSDHCGGLDEVLALTDVAEIWENGETLPSSSYQSFAEARDEEGAQILVAQTGLARQHGGVQLTVLAADRGYPDENNDSIVIAFDFAGVRVLTTGDIEAEAQADLLDEQGGALESEIVKVPHHGSWNLDDGFVSAVSGDFGVISCGAGNDFGHPHDEALDAWLGVGTTLCRTDQSGDVGVRITADGQIERGCLYPIEP